MKVAIVSEWEYGNGAAIAAFRLAAALNQRQVDVHFLFRDPHYGTPRGGFSRESLGLLSWPQQAISRTLWRVRPGLSARFLRWSAERQLTERLRRIEPDVVNLHNVGTLLDHAAINRLSQRWPVVWTLHDCFAVKPYSYQFVDLNGTIQQTTARQLGAADLIARRQLLESDANIRFVTPSAWLGQHIASEIRGNKPLETIANGLDPDLFRPLEKSVARRKLGLEPDRLVLLFVATKLSYPRKNLEVLIDALGMLKRPCRLLALGGAEQELLQRLRSVRFLPATFDLQQIRTIYSAADLFVIPSLVDNLPNTVLESLFCGTPVLGARAGGIPEMVREGETGWLFDPRDPESLRELIDRLADEPGRAAELAARCHLLAKERFGAKQQAVSYTRCFSNALSASR